MTTDLDDLITTALRHDAQHAPTPPPGGFAPSQPSRNENVARPRLARLLGAAAAVVAAVGVAAVTWGTGRSNLAVVQEAWTPVGVEYPLRDLGPATTSSVRVTLAEVGHTIGVEGHPNLVVTEELWPITLPVDPDRQVSGPWELIGTTSTRHRCVGGFCHPRPSSDDTADDTPDLAWTSSVDNGAADFNLWIWANVPDTVAFVSFTDHHDNVLWQRPIEHVAAFPVDGHPRAGAIVTTYDNDGRTLSTMDAWPYNEPDGEPSEPSELPPSELPPSVRLDVDQARSLNELNDRVLTECLTAAGAEFDETGGLGVLNGAGDADIIWETCVHTTQLSVEAVAEYLASSPTAYPDPDDVQSTGPSEQPDPEFSCNGCDITLSAEQAAALDDYLTSLPDGAT